jgi:hypothetical protein
MNDNSDAVQAGVDAERKRCADIAQKQFEYWKRALQDSDEYENKLAGDMFGGAMGASANIFCAILFPEEGHFVIPPDAKQK